MKRAYSSKLSLVAAAVVLGGCAITPTALDDIQLAENAELNLAQVTADQEPIHGRIGLYEAIARALKYNLDHRV
ncbi:MAG: TolC family protein, partial [Pseudomonadota bacterium]